MSLTPKQIAINAMKDIINKGNNEEMIIKQSRILARLAGGGFWIEMAYQNGDKVQWRPFEWVSNKEDAIVRMKKVDRVTLRARRFRIVSENHVVCDVESVRECKS